MIFFANFIAEPVEVEEGEEKKEQPKDFKPLVDLHNTTKLEGKAQTSYEDIINHFLISVFDRKEEEIENHLPKFFQELIKSGIIPKGAWNTGISRFVQILPSLVCDVPHLPKLFANFVLISLVDAKLIDIKSINWLATDKGDDEDDYIESEGNFKVMAHYMLAKNPKDMGAWFADNCKVFLEGAYKDAVCDAAYLITEITEAFGDDADKA